MRAVGKTIGMLILCLVALACCWGSMLSTVIRCDIMEGCRGFDGPAGWLFWLAPVAIFGLGAKFLAGFLAEGLDNGEGWALGCFWVPLMIAAMLLVLFS